MANSPISILDLATRASPGVIAKLRRDGHGVFAGSLQRPRGSTAPFRTRIVALFTPV